MSGTLSVGAFDTSTSGCFVVMFATGDSVDAQSAGRRPAGARSAMTLPRPILTISVGEAFGPDVPILGKLISPDSSIIISGMQLNVDRSASLFPDGSYIATVTVTGPLYPGGSTIFIPIVAKGGVLRVDAAVSAQPPFNKPLPFSFQAKNKAVISLYGPGIDPTKELPVPGASPSPSPSPTPTPVPIPPPVVPLPSPSPSPSLPPSSTTTLLHEENFVPLCSTFDNSTVLKQRCDIFKIYSVDVTVVGGDLTVDMDYEQMNGQEVRQHTVFYRYTLQQYKLHSLSGLDLVSFGPSYLYDKFTWSEFLLPYGAIRSGDGTCDSHGQCSLPINFVTAREQAQLETNFAAYRQQNNF